MRTPKHDLPEAVAKRIPIYYRYFKLLETDGIDRIKSEQLAKLVAIPSATIRRDFSYIGDLGRSGYGYEVSHLIQIFSAVLKADILTKMAVIGVGNLGRALIENNFRRNDNLQITCAFDTNPALVGQTLNGVPIYAIDQLATVIPAAGITTAISTVPSEASQRSAEQLIDAGITSILNFAPTRLQVPRHINVRYLDLTAELQTLLLFEE
ncbi:redox-sensing transcriptional repressor Rex [Latilactobacillus sakei]|uniref:redox-sensing transcriptional repressor Rex n=1 Tax=Latilactobacillus sakei TaxID=1599 RepID=UPI003884D0EC